MHLRRTSAASALALLAGVLGTFGLPATAARADSAVILPITHFAHMVVADGHVFISGGSGNGPLLVTDLDGTTVADLTGEAGANGLAVSPDGDTVYAALPDAHAVTAIDASTLDETARYPVGDTTSPQDLAFAGGRIWFSYGAGGNGGIGSVDTGTTPATVTLKQTGDFWYSAPVLTASPADPDVLAAADSDSEPPYISVYDASGPSLGTTVRSWMQQSGAVGDMAFTADGSGLLVASGFPQYVQAYRPSDLTDAWSYQTGAYPDAVAVAPDGTVATGIENANADNAVEVYPAGAPASGTTPTPAVSYDYQQSTVANAGLAWSPDSRTLFAVTADIYGTTFSLHVLPDPTRAPDTLTLTVDNTTDVGHPVSLTGNLSADQAIPAGATLHLTRTGPGIPSTVTATLPDITTGPDGAFSTTDVPEAEGDSPYRVSYDGDAGHRAATATAVAQLVKADSTPVFGAVPTAVRGQALSIPGQLADGPYPSGATVTVSRTDAASPGGSKPWSAAVRSDGSFSVKDTPQIGGTVHYTVSYPGDAAHNASKATVTVQVSRTATKVTVAANASSYAYAATATVTAHLGTTYNGRSVSIYAQPYGGAKVLVKTGKVNSKGNLTATYKLSRGTTFSASFPGDYRYAPATATKAVTAHAKVAEALGGYYTSTHVGSTLYRVYHHTAKPGVAAGVTPNKAGECVKLTLQEYYSGAWHTTLTVACAKLGSSSTTAGSLILKNATGHRFRIDAEYLPSASDHGNLATTGSWLYFTVRT